MFNALYALSTVISLLFKRMPKVFSKLFNLNS